MLCVAVVVNTAGRITLDEYGWPANRGDAEMDLYSLQLKAMEGKLHIHEASFSTQGGFGETGFVEPIWGQFIVNMKKNITSKLVEQLSTASSDPSVRTAPGAVIAQVLNKYAGFAGFSAKLSPAALDLALHHADVAFIEQDVVVKSAEYHHLRTSTDTIKNSAVSWHLDRLNGTFGKSCGIGATSGAGVDVYIIDTGVNPEHDAYRDILLGGINFVPDGGFSRWADCNGHGTHCAGLAVGRDHGIARGASLVAVRALDCDGAGSLSTVTRAIDWVVYNARLRGRPSVASLSLGLGATSRSLNLAVRGAVDAGVTVVAAAGNEGVDACGVSPASEEAAITVAATDRGDRRAPFSNYGRCVDLYAPGAGVVSAGIGSNTAVDTLSGTSMATPLAAGAAALELAAMATEGVGAAPARVRDRLVRAAAVDAVGDARFSPSHFLQLSLGAPTSSDAVAVDGGGGMHGSHVDQQTSAPQGLAFPVIAMIVAGAGAAVLIAFIGLLVLKSRTKRQQTREEKQPQEKQQEKQEEPATTNCANSSLHHGHSICGHTPREKPSEDQLASIV